MSGDNAFDAVIALTDIYTGTTDFKDAADAKSQMIEWAGNNPNFYPHTAVHDFEAWLLPYWKTIQACPELKAFVNRIIFLCDPSQIIP